jgi:hypothetical protein
MPDINVGNIDIRVWNYCHRYSGNYGTHSQAIAIGDLTLYFSYDTVIAFKTRDGAFYSENLWQGTTGKHLNELCQDKRKRLKREVFEQRLQQTLKDYKWTQLLGV